MTTEERRLHDSEARKAHWPRWGPYLSERAWGTVREDYSPGGTAWEFLPHDHARSKAYRWNEDGLAGICDRHQAICFALALWNGRDPILKERLFGLTGNEGNHGEDVKEYYYYLDSTPTHSYMKCLYKYPQAAFPYEALVAENRRRGKGDPEYELVDTGVFDQDRYFDVTVEYAKATVEEMLVRITAVNRGPEDAEVHLLPTIWFRNVWSWGRGESKPSLRAPGDAGSGNPNAAPAPSGDPAGGDPQGDGSSPGPIRSLGAAAASPAGAGGPAASMPPAGAKREAKRAAAASSTPASAKRTVAGKKAAPRGAELVAESPPVSTIQLDHAYYGRRWLHCEGSPALLFTENETNSRRLYGVENDSPWVKDAFHEHVVQGRPEAVNPSREGTKAAAHYRFWLGPGQSVTVRLRLTDRDAGAETGQLFDPEFDRVFAARIREADEFYATVIPTDLSDDAKSVMRQALGGLLWSKQFYHYVIEQWLQGDPAFAPPPSERLRGRNHDWTHLYNADVLSMPDKWEYPWYAAWDLAFHCLPLALVDSSFAKEQLVLLLREWYMHPNGQLPAYEWALSDVNPPVHAWAAWRVYKIEKKRRGKGDIAFLERVFHKLMLNFTWWVNRKDAEGMNLFQGGFLGLDNIGVFDRSAPLPAGGHLEQSDGTSWMAMYTLNLLAIALELANQDPAYEDVASKFWEHFVYIAHAMNNLGHGEIEMWNEEDGFFYDVLHMPNGDHFPVKVRSMVGLIPLFAVETLEPELLNRLPGFKRRLEWFIENRPDLTANVACMRTPGREERRLLSVVDQQKLRRVLSVMLDEREFLSPYGIRAVSRFHKDHPYVLSAFGAEYRVDYEPAESSTGLFGGNSNWRGPIWFPVNYLIIESLQKFHHYLGEDFKVECPTGSGTLLNLWDVAAELSRRLTRIFLRGPDGRRPVWGGTEKFQTDPHWRELVPFHEYFHGDNGAGIGASHQTGWTGLVAKLLQQSGE